jgi:hypothetical protein
MAGAFAVVLAGTGHAAAGVHSPGATRPAVLAGTWGTVREVPGMSALNKGVARIDSVSCSSPGYCSAGGFYGGPANGTAYGQPFVVNEVNGTWHKAIPVPGVLALNTRKNGFVSSVSCTRPGDCSAGGRYVGPKGARAFVVDEVNGVWHQLITLAVSGGGDVEVSALACASPGNCSAAGTNSDLGSSRGLEGAFVVNKVNGRWQRPIEIPGKFSWVYGAWVQSVSCPSAGNCTAGGWYDDSYEQSQAFVVSEVNGTWHNYITVPGTSAFRPGYGAQVRALSCPRPGNCTVAGNYIGEAGFLASEVNGDWHNATPVPGLAKLLGSGSAQVPVLSCATPGNCSAGGAGLEAGTVKGFVVNEVNGSWHNAIEVPGMRALSASGNWQVTALSCPAAGNCSAAGYYGDRSGTSQGFVVNEVNGSWHNAIEVPGMSALNPSRNGQVTALSCAKAGRCSAGGIYAAPPYGIYAGQVFVVSEG